jgi:D-xylose transport system substrate-binding protein
LQTDQAENLLTQGIDVLMIAPHNGEVAASIVEAAKRQNVPVISYDRLVRNSDVDLYVSHQAIKWVRCRRSIVWIARRKATM